MAITTNPKSQTIVQIELARTELLQAAELATGSNGKVDLNKVPQDLSDAMKQLAGHSSLDAASLKNRLDSAMKLIHGIDAGKLDDLYFGYQGMADTEAKVMSDYRDSRQGAINESPIGARIRFFLHGAGDLEIDAAERNSIRESHDTGAAVLLAVADTRRAAKDSKTLAETHLKGQQWIGNGEGGPNKPCFAWGDAGALKGIAKVMMKHNQSGKWSVTDVNADGSYRLPLKAEHGEFTVWYEKNNGDSFRGGNVLLFAGSKQYGLAGFARANGRSRHAAKLPLDFAPHSRGQ